VLGLRLPAAAGGAFGGGARGRALAARTPASVLFVDSDERAAAAAAAATDSAADGPDEVAARAVRYVVAPQPPAGMEFCDGSLRLARGGGEIGARWRRAGAADPGAANGAAGAAALFTLDVDARSVAAVAPADDAGGGAAAEAAAVGRVVGPLGAARTTVTRHGEDAPSSLRDTSSLRHRPRLVGLPLLGRSSRDVVVRAAGRDVWRAGRPVDAPPPEPPAAAGSVVVEVLTEDAEDAARGGRIWLALSGSGACSFELN